MVEATHCNNGSIDEPQSDDETHYHSDVEGQRYAYRLIHGVPGPPFMRQSVCASLRKTWSPRNDDVFVVTYPKSGTTWMQQVLLLLLRGGGTEDYDLTVKSADSPWLEGTLSQTFEPRTREWLDALPSRRILKTHSPLRIFPSIPGENGAMPYAGGAKTIFVVRNPKDTAVSFFHHARNKAAFQFADGKWPAFFDIFMRGGVGSGDWFEFVTEWWDLAQRRPASVLWVHYEEMLKSPGAQILRIAHFLGVAPVDEQRLSRPVSQPCTL